MTAAPRISIITPTLNAGRTLRRAIQSVRCQGYPNLEHVIVDGGSTDDTEAIATSYPHVVWLSEPDRGQSDAMNKGFAMATGEIIGYLNADDYYLPCAFDEIAPAFHAGADFVVGNILILRPNGSVEVNAPRADRLSFLYHWEPDAFPVNPVGYFYRRHVQEAVGGYNIDNAFTMDLEFLLAAASKFRFTRVASRTPLGLFDMHSETKTALSSENSAMHCSPKRFAFTEPYVSALPNPDRSAYRRSRRHGYRICRLQHTLARTRRTQESIALLPRYVLLRIILYFYGRYYRATSGFYRRLR